MSFVFKLTAVIFTSSWGFLMEICNEAVIFVFLIIIVYSKAVQGYLNYVIGTIGSSNNIKYTSSLINKQYIIYV